MTAAINDGLLTLGETTWEARWIGPKPAAAPTLIFLHEGLGCVGMWKDFPDQLAASTGCGGFVYSRLGYGKSDPVDLPRPLDYMQQEGREVLPRLLDALEIERAVLVGHSDGASIAIVHAGLDTSGRIKGLILEAPHVFAEPFGLVSIKKFKTMYETTDLRERLARYHGDNVDCAFRGWNDAWLDPDFTGWNLEPFLPDITAPILIVQGEDDEYGSAAQLNAIESQAGGGAEILMLPNCGHSPHHEHTDTVLDAMTTFVSRVVG